MNRDADPNQPLVGAHLARGALGGLLMGLANLVPGISGGTMLLATGVYSGFVAAIAELTTLRFRPRSMLLLGVIGATAALAILLFAGPTRALVIEQRWVMYSLFIGLTLGGVPLVWRLARPASPAVVAGAAVAFLAMVAMSFGLPARSGAESNALLLGLGGVAGASAMILPGVSGGYLLLLLGQYEPILAGIDTLKQGLLGAGAPRMDLLLESMGVVVPVGIGVVVGVVGVSNLIHWLLDRYRKATLGALLGLLLGAVVGLWPFQQGTPAQAGDVVKGKILTAESAAALDPEDWPVRRFPPSFLQVLAALGLIAAGFGATVAIAHLGGGEDDVESPSQSG